MLQFCQPGDSQRLAVECALAVPLRRGVLFRQHVQQSIGLGQVSRAARQRRA